MSIIVSKHSGFCFGVARAVKMLEKSLAENKTTYCIGEMIHNPVFIADAERRGLITIDENSVDTIKPGSNVIIRSHGIRKELEQKLKSKDFVIIDATCPDVKKIHKIIDENTDEKSLLIIIGNDGHPEVIASSSYCKGKFLVFTSQNEMKSAFTDFDFSPYSSVIMVAQTTHSVSDYENCKNFLKKLYTNAKIYDTICSVTEARQQEAAKLSKEVDMMLVIGGSTSSNTKKLFDICRQNCKNTFFVETADNIPPICDGLKIGIAAGASTPNGLIEEVTNKCQKK